MADRYVALAPAAHTGGPYLAYDAKLERKVLLTRIDGDDPQALARGLAQARRLAKLDHPKLAGVLDAGLVEQQLFVAMQQFDGDPAPSWLARAPAPRWRERLSLLLDAAEAVARAHGADLVDGELTLERVLVGRDGRARVSQFGLARVRAAIDGSADVELDAREDQRALCQAFSSVMHEIRSPAWVRAALARGAHSNPAARWASLDALVAHLRRRLRARHQARPALALATLALTLGVGLARAQTPDLTCTGATQQLEGVWDRERERQLVAALTRTDQPYAADTAERVRDALDGYARAWAAKFEHVCEQTHVAGTQTEAELDLRMACLEQRRVALREATQQLSAGDASRLASAAQLVASLPSLDRCDQLDVLRLALPPPEDPQLAAEVATMRELLERVRTLEQLADYDAAQAVLATLQPHVEALAHAPLSAETELARGRLALAQARYDEAATALERAYTLGVERAHPRVQAEAAATMVTLVGMGRERFDESRRWGAVAEALAGRAGIEPLLEAEVRNRIGRVLRVQGDYDRALAHFELALDLQATELRPPAPQIAATLGDIASMLSLRGEYDESLATSRRALAMQEASLGPEHPALAATLMAMAGVHLHRGENPEAELAARRALDIREAALGPEHPEVAEALERLAASMGRQARFAEALELSRRALTIERTTHGPRHTKVAQMLFRISIDSFFLGEVEQSLEPAREALSIYEQALGPTHADIAEVLKFLSDILGALGQPEAARDHAERAVAMFEQVYGADHPKLMGPLITLANAYAPGSEARIFALQRVIDIGETRQVARSAVAMARGNMANDLLDRGELEQAFELLELARRDYAQSLGEDHPNVAQVWLSIASVQVERGELDAAAEAFARSHALLAANFELGHPHLAHPLLGAAQLELRRRDFTAAAELAEAALAAGTAAQDLHQRANANEFLARARWGLGARAQAIDAAMLALTDYRELEDAASIATLEAWLRRHGARVPAPPTTP